MFLKKFLVVPKHWWVLWFCWVYSNLFRQVRDRGGCTRSPGDHQQLWHSRVCQLRFIGCFANLCRHHALAESFVCWYWHFHTCLMFETLVRGLRKRRETFYPPASLLTRMSGHCYLWSGTLLGIRGPCLPLSNEFTQE